MKSGRGDKISGMLAFRKRYPRAKTWLIGASGIKLEEFSSRTAITWFHREAAEIRGQTVV